MILSTHAAVGAAAAEFTNNPAIALAIGFASHFILDAIPHWDYELRSLRADVGSGFGYDMPIGRDFAIDFLKMAVDALFGTAAGLLFYGLWLTPEGYVAAFFGAAGGLLPDVLQFVHMKICRLSPRNDLVPVRAVIAALQNFHNFIHTRHRFRGRYIFGSVFQILLVLAVFTAIKELV